MNRRLNTLPDGVLEQAADWLKVMAHPARLKMVSFLTQGRFAVHELADLCETSPNQTCEHLRLLKGHGLLTSHREGRTVYYEIGAPQLPHLIECIRRSCQV